MKNKYFINLSINKITNTSSITFSKALFGFAKIFSGGLIFGEFLGRSITALVCLIFAFKKDKEFFFMPKFNELKTLAKKYIIAPKFLLPSQAINTIGGQLPVLLMAAFFSIQDIGYFSMALAILSLPASLVSLAVRDAFRKKAYDIFSETGNCFGLYRDTLFVMAILSFLGFSVFYFLAPQLFSIVLGKDWIIAGEYARILVPIVAVSFVSETGSAMFIIGDKMKELLFWQISYFLLTVVPLLIGIIIFNNFKDTLICFMIGRTISHILSFIITSRIANGK